MDTASIVVSTAGRDRGSLFFVLATEDNYALLADGKTRRIGQPKRKKLKHLQFVAESKSRVAEKLRAGDKVLDSEIRRALAEFKAGYNSQKPGR